MTETTPFEIETYQTQDGKSPFTDWLRTLKDRAAGARIRTRLARLRLGNFGDTNTIGGGLHELRIDHGPGYRVYFGRSGHRIILLLCGGTKRTQSRDIEQAKTYWNDYRSRTE